MNKVLLAFNGIISEGSDSEFKIGDDIVVEVVEEELEFESDVFLRYIISANKISPEDIPEILFNNLYGDIEAEHGCIPYSEWTGFVGWSDTLSVGGHDLIRELMGYEGKYCYLEFSR